MLFTLIYTSNNFNIKIGRSRNYDEPYDENTF